MRYVFFDIECASVGKQYAKICAFGYVLTDETFGVLEKEDILLNPKGGFHLTDRKGERGLVLPYEYKEFRNHPSFKAVYPRIRALLEAEDVLPVGHAAINDVKYLCLETKRFSLPSFRFSFADTQQLYMARKNDFSHQYGLESIVGELQVEFTPHRAADDAYATMKIAETLCREEGCSFPALLERYGVPLGRIEDYRYSQPACRSQIAYREEARRKKAERERQRGFFFRLVNKRRNRNLKDPVGVLAGRKFCFSRSLEEDPSFACPLLEEIYAAGGRYVTRLSECDTFVAREGEEGERLRQARRAELCVLCPEELREMLQ